MKNREQQEQEVRAVLDRHRGPGRGHKYPKEVRQHVGAYVREARAAGVSLAALSRRLDVADVTLTRWAGAAPPGGGIRPVRVLPVGVSSPPEVGTRTVRVVSPTGWRVEGLSPAEAVAMLREVGR